jgi:hypothetical protein
MTGSTTLDVDAIPFDPNPPVDPATILTASADNLTLVGTVQLAQMRHDLNQTSKRNKDLKHQ